MIKEYIDNYNAKFFLGVVAKYPLNSEVQDLMNLYYPIITQPWEKILLRETNEGIDFLVGEIVIHRTNKEMDVDKKVEEILARFDLQYRSLILRLPPKSNNVKRVISDRIELLELHPKGKQGLIIEEIEFLKEIRDLL